MLTQMDIDAPSKQQKNGIPGLKHWLFQTAPPVLMLTVFLTTSSGPSLVFLTGLLILPVLISLISIIAKLIFFEKRKYYLARPALTIAVFILIFVIAHWTHQMALEQTIEEGKKIQQLCNHDRACPDNPVGWQADFSGIRKNDLGFWLKYSASYYRDSDSFSIRL